MRDLDGSRGGDAVEVELVADQMGKTYEIVTAAAFDAEEVGAEDGFPQYGTFLKCRGSDDEGVWVEMPADLEVKLSKEADRSPLEGRLFRVVTVSKNVDGDWQYNLEWFDDWDGARESLSQS